MKSFAPPREHVPIRTPAQLRLVRPWPSPTLREKEIIDKYKPRIAEALGALRLALASLAEDVQDAPFAVAFRPEYELVNGEEMAVHYQRLDHGDSIAATKSAYCTLELGPHDPVNKPIRCPGVIGVREQRIIDHAVEINRLKSQLKFEFQQVVNHRITVVKKDDRGRDVIDKIPAALFIMRQLQESSLNRLAAYRQIPLIRTGAKDPHPPTPIRVRFTESSVRRLDKATVAELRAEAIARDRKDSIKKLDASRIPSNEYLFHPEKHYRRVRANLTFPGASPKAKMAKHYMGEMPILFLMNRKLANPVVTGPKVREKTLSRTRKSNKPLFDEPVVENPNYYRRADPAHRAYSKDP